MSIEPISLIPLEFPLTGARLIEASAGTGKTWTIAALYVRLILGHGGEDYAHGRPLLPPEILVVTFTEAATQELRDRIRKRLNEAARCFRGLGQPDGFLAALIQDYPGQQHSACARLLDVAAQWMDEAAVFTIHGWCNRMLRQHAFDSGSLFKLEIETSDAELLNEVARDYWRGFFYPLDESASLAVAKLADSPKSLLRKLQGLLNETDAQWRSGDAVFESVADPQSLLNAWGAWEGQRRELEDKARQAWADGRETIEKILREASAKGWLNGSRYRKDSFEARLEGLAAWASYGEPCDPKWLEGFAQGRFQMNKAYQDKAPQHPAFVALNALAGQQDGEPEFNQEILVHAARWVRERFALEKQRRALMDFNDLLTHLDQALQRKGGPRLAEVIRRQYPVALIDEFQDTDPVQYRIFAAVYPIGNLPLCQRVIEGDYSNQEIPPSPPFTKGGTQASLFMIGDPKQAIYSFRGADIHTYLQARRATEGRHYTLDTNFRSTQAMVEAVNQIFGHADAQPGGAFLFKQASSLDPLTLRLRPPRFALPEERGLQDNPLPFRPVIAQGRPGRWWVQGESAPALTLWHLPPEEGDAAYPIGEYRRIMAQSAASEIVRLLNLAAQGKAGFQTDETFQALKPADLAILVRDRIEAGEIRRALAQRRVRSVYLSDRESVFRSLEAFDLLLWLKACAEPERDRVLRAALGSATLALRYGDLEILNSEELRWEAEVERFRGYRTIWRYQGVLPMLRRLMADFKVPARLLHTQDGERRLTNLLHLAELLQGASADLDGEQALIRYLEEARDSEDQASDETLLRLESDADLIKVVSIHKSKGLEYPLVFLPFICSFKEVNGKQTYFRYHDGQGRLQVDLAKTDESKRQAELERLQEDLRLLYVALTRPRHACWLGLAAVKSGNVKACQLDKSAIGQVLNGGVSLKADELEGLLLALKGDCEPIHITPPPAASNAAYTPSAAVVELTEARPYRGRAAERWWIASYSALKLDEAGQTAAGLNPIAEPPDTPRQANLEEADEPSSPPAVLAGALDMHRFPRGAKPGTFLHGLLEWAARDGFGRVARDAVRRKDNVARRCHTRGWENWINPLNDWLGQLLALPLGPVALADLDKTAYQPELEFWFAAAHVDTLALDRLVTAHTLQAQPRPRLLPDRLNGMLKGFMDLVFEHQGRYYVVDYKSNWLGTDSSAYTVAAMAEAVLEKRYELQYTLYLLAMHRQLKARLGEAYDYDRHIGGAVYVFLRGLDGPCAGLHLEKPPRVLIEALDGMFAGKGSRPKPVISA